MSDSLHITTRTAWEFRLHGLRPVGRVNREMVLALARVVAGRIAPNATPTEGAAALRGIGHEQLAEILLGE